MSKVISEIEKKIDQLSHQERLWLIERLARSLRESSTKDQSILESQLDAMASDPEIQRELKTINREFAVYENGVR